MDIFKGSVVNWISDPPHIFKNDLCNYGILFSKEILSLFLL